MEYVINKYETPPDDVIEQLSLILDRATAQRDHQKPPQVASETSLKDVSERIHRVSAQTFVAESLGNITGFAISHPLIDTDSLDPSTVDTDHLALLMTDPDYWGEGIASQLLADVVTQTRSEGRTKLSLWTRKEDNERARSLYLHKGFAETGETREKKDGSSELRYMLTLS